MNDVTPPQQQDMNEERVITVEKFSRLFGRYLIGSNNHINNSRTSTSSQNINSDANASDSNQKKPSAASLISSRIADGIYGATTKATALSPAPQYLASAMDQYLYRDDNDMIGGAIISVPALELQPMSDAMAKGNDANSDNRQNGASAVLPSLGMSSKPAKGSFIPFIPPMVSSVLPLNNSNSNNNNTQSQSVEEASISATKLEKAASKDLGRAITYTRSSAPHAPSVMTRALFDSFTSLVESRVKAWTLLLLRQSLSSGDETSRGRLMSLLASDNVELSAIVTTFNVEKKIMNTANNSEKSDSLTLPLTFEVDIDLKLHDKMISLHLEAKGTVEGKSLLYIIH